MEIYNQALNLTLYFLALSFPVSLVFYFSRNIIASFLGVVFGKDISF